SHPAPRLESNRMTDATSDASRRAATHLPARYRQRRFADRGDRRQSAWRPARDADDYRGRRRWPRTFRCGRTSLDAAALRPCADTPTRNGLTPKTAPDSTRFRPLLRSAMARRAAETD